MFTQRMPVGLLVMVPVLAGLALYAFTAQEPVPDPNAAATATVENASPTPSPTEATDYEATATAEDATRTALFDPSATPTLPAPAARGELHEGAWVRVNAGAGDCLNARNAPSLAGDYVIIYGCLPDGFEGYLTGTAMLGDGHWWWYLAGAGYVAEDYLVYVRDVDPSQILASELAGFGRIAFIRDYDVWVMDADGGRQHKVVETGEFDPYAYDLRWSPDGTMLSFWTRSGGAPGDLDGSTDLHIVRLSGDGLGSDTVYRDLAGSSWSPDSTRIGIIRVETPDQMGSGIKGVPGILDVRDGSQLVFGSESFFQQDPPAFNFDGSLLIVTKSVWEQGNDGFRGILVWDVDGTERYIIRPPEGEYYSQPTWSPVDNRIVIHIGDSSGRSEYAVYDLDNGILASATAPEYSTKIGGRCGGSDMWRMDWSRDGSSVLYGFDMGDTNSNGIWVWEVASGKQRLVPAAGAGPASSYDGSLFAFSSWGAQKPYIFVGNTAGGFPRLITEGSSPVWSPR